jgi:tRNA pseudouridine32 synthase / 23S rRNA pseudouridine746 synthase
LLLPRKKESKTLPTVEAGPHSYIALIYIYIYISIFYLNRYIALVNGWIEGEEGFVDLPLSRHPTGPSPWQCVNDKHGKPSHTNWRVLSRESFEIDPGSHPLPVTRLELSPVTGRSHQLRVHMAAIGHPILGDPLYGLPLDIHESCQPKERQRLYLHAESVTVNHPVTRAEMTFSVACAF